MSFQASARTVRDASRPLGCRVQALHQCLEAFSPFGFQATRVQLRKVLRVDDAGWTEQQLLHGLGLLEQARRSWVAARDGADVRTYQPENRFNRALPEGGEPFPVWLARYLGEAGNAEGWGVADLGACPACGHLVVVHGRGCWACRVEMGGIGEPSCQLRSPLEVERWSPTRPPADVRSSASWWRDWRSRRRQHRR